MAARARYEWVTLGLGVHRNGAPEGVIVAMHGTPGTITGLTTSAAIASGSRPAAPAFGDQSSGYVLVTALDNAVIVAVGANPTASDSSGKRIQPGIEVPIFIKTGDLISFIEAA